MIVFLIFMIIVNILLFGFLTYSIYKFRAAQNIMKRFNVDISKIDFDFWNNYGVGGVENVRENKES